MSGKFYFLAVAVTIFVQVSRGDENLENAIPDGLARVEGTRREGQLVVMKAHNDVYFYLTVARSKAQTYLNTMKKDLEEMKGDMRNLSNLMREQATTWKKPESVFLCFEEVEKAANSTPLYSTWVVETLTKVYLLYMSREADTYINFFRRDEIYLEETYEEVVERINNCENASCVEHLVGSFESGIARWEENVTETQRYANERLVTYVNRLSEKCRTLNAKGNKVRRDFTIGMTECLYGPSEYLKDAIGRGVPVVDGILHLVLSTFGSLHREFYFYGQRIFGRIDRYVEGTIRLQNEVRKHLSLVVEKTKEEAKQTEKPQSVFECIDRVHSEANDEVNRSTEKFEREWQSSKTRTSEVIDFWIDFMQLPEKRMRVLHRNAVEEIKKSKKAESVKRAVDNFDSLAEDHFRDAPQLHKSVVGDFRYILGTLEVRSFFQAKEDITKIETESVRKVRECLRG